MLSHKVWCRCDFKAFQIVPPRLMLGKQQRSALVRAERKVN